MIIAELHKAFLSSSGVTTDTRNIQSGQIYFALKGANFNGNAFAAQALEQGAMLSVVDEAAYADHDQCVLVEDVLTTLQDLARYHRRTLTGVKFIGLTGSNGKTTAKELFKSVLETQYKVSATIGNLNNHIGVPLTLLKITPEHDWAIVEMGANHQKEIEMLSGIALPDYGYITNFGKAHLEGFGGVEGVIKGKSELYANLRQHGGTAIVNFDDAKQVELTADLPQVSYGISQGDYHFSYFTENSFQGIRWNGHSALSNLTGQFQNANIGAACTVGKIAGISDENIARGIHAYVPSNNRAEFRNTASNKVLLDAYNANPSSMEASIANFATLPGESKVMILGDMFELGEYAAEEHQKIVDQLKNLGFKNAILVGEHFCATAHQPYTALPKSEDAARFLEQHPIKNALVLLKGSRGMALEKLLPLL